MVVHEDPGGRTGVEPNVALGPEGRVTRYAKGTGTAGLRYIEAGVVALEAAAVRPLPEGRVASLEAEVYPELVAGGRMAAWVTAQRFYDIGTPEGLRSAERFFLDAAGGEGRGHGHS